MIETLLGGLLGGSYADGGSMSFRVESNGLNLRVWARTGLRAGA